MMKRVDAITAHRHGPAKKPHKLKPFVAIDLPNNPWVLCRPENQDAILVTYGHAWKIAQTLTANMTQSERDWVIHERRTYKYRDGRALEIHFRTMRDGSSIQGGKIWLRNSRGVSVTIHDVKGMFQLTWRKLCKMYKTDDLAEIMERTRASLASVGITSYQQQWWLCSSLVAHIWRQLDINLSNVPAVSASKGPGNLQGYYVFGHTDHPVYSYDIHSAYLSIMAEFPALKPFTDYVWHARKELEQAHDPAAYLLKLLATIMPGKFTSRHKSNKFYRPVLGQYIRQSVNDRLQAAMSLANSIEAPTQLNVFRYCVDGFIAFSNIGNYLDIGDNLGQWKPVKKHEHLTIAKTNVWFTNREYKDGGYSVSEPLLLQSLEASPFEIPTTRTTFDWNLLEERVEPITLRQPHEWTACRRCFELDGRQLHDCL